MKGRSGFIMLRETIFERGALRFQFMLSDFPGLLVAVV